MAPPTVGLAEKLFWILAYSGCSSTMLVINKLAVGALPLPTVVSGAQLVVSAAVVVVMQMFGAKVMGPMDRTRVVPFVLYTAMFAAGLFANIEGPPAHQRRRGDRREVMPPRHRVHHRVGVHGQVSAVRAIHALPRGRRRLRGPLHPFRLGRRRQRRQRGHVWLFIWWMLLALQMTYGKWMTEKIEMTQWERVFYTNAFAILPTILLFFFTGEFGNVSDVEMGDGAWFWLIASCVMGVGISYSGWRTRSVITATTFTLVGVLNKMATIAFTVIVWPNDTTAASILALVFCILFGLLYQDAPKRKERPSIGGHKATMS